MTWTLASRCAGPLIACIVLLFAAIMNAWSPASAFELWQSLGVPEKLNDSATLSLVIAEVILAVLLLLRPGSAKVRLLALIAFGSFSAVLIAFLFMANPPNCGCLGKVRLFESKKAELVFGVGRNLILSTGLLWGFPKFSRPSRSHPAGIESSAL